MGHDAEKSARLAANVRHYGRFCLVGGTGVLVDMGVLWAVSDPAMLGWNLTLGKILAAGVAMGSNFLLNDIWTFRGMSDPSGGWRGRRTRFLRFTVICMAGIVLSILLLHLQVRGLGMNVYVANFGAIVATSLWNFLMNLKFSWTGRSLRSASDRQSVSS